MLAVLPLVDLRAFPLLGAGAGAEGGVVVCVLLMLMLMLEKNRNKQLLKFAENTFHWN